MVLRGEASAIHQIARSMKARSKSPTAEEDLVLLKYLHVLIYVAWRICLRLVRKTSQVQRSRTSTFAACSAALCREESWAIDCAAAIRGCEEGISDATHQS